MFVQAGQLHIQRNANQNHQHKRTISHPAFKRPLRERFVEVQQNDLAYKTKVAGNEQRVVQNDESGIIECRADHTFPVSSALGVAHETLLRKNCYKQVAIRSKSLGCHPISEIQLQGVAVLNETAEDLDSPQIGNSCNQRELESKHPNSTQTKRHTITGPSRQYDDQYVNPSYSSKSDGSRDYKSKLQVNDIDYNTISCCREEGLRSKKNLMGEGILSHQEQICSASSTVRCNSWAFYYKSLTRLIGYLIIIGRALRKHLQLGLSISNSSRGHLLLVPSFCVNFIAYQLETWVHLVRSANAPGEYGFSEQSILLLNSKQCKFRSRRATDPNQRNSIKLAWRKRGNQFNKSVDEMYGAGARLSLSTNRAPDHQLAHQKDRLSIDQQFSDKYSRTKRQSEKVAAGVTVYVQDLPNKNNLSSSSDRSTLDYDSPNQSPSLASISKLKQQQVGPKGSFVNGDLIVTRPINLQSICRMSPRSCNSSDNQIEANPFINQYSLSSNSNNTSCPLPISGSLPTSIEEINNGGPNRFVHSKSQLGPVYDDYHSNRIGEHSRVKYFMPISVETEPDSDWRGSSSSVVSRSIQHNYLIGNRQNDPGFSRHKDQEKYFNLVDNNPSEPTSNYNSFGSFKSNFVGSGRRSIDRDSHLHSTANNIRLNGLQRQNYSEPPSIDAIRNSYQLSISPTHLRIDPKLNKPTQQVDNEANKESRLKSNESFESKTRSTSSTSGKKSSSYSKLSLAGAKKRLGLKQKGLNSLSVQRSEEVVPFEVRRFVRQITAASLTDSGNESFTNQSDRNSSGNSLMTKLPAGFVSGLGDGQIASRQALVSPYLGDIQLSLSDQKGLLEVEVVRASRLLARTSSKTLPSPFVKVYLIKHRKCLAKFKTRPIKETLNPLYQEKFTFQQDYTDCLLQVIVWGDYGKKSERKSLMGIVQIRLNDLDVSNLLIGWYQLFNASSIVSSLLPSGAIRQVAMGKNMKW